MAKQIEINGWVSIIPDSMYKDGVRRGYFKDGRLAGEVSEEQRKKIREAISDWYGKVFDYVENWLEKEDYIQLQKGSFSGGFCAEYEENEATENWGAPLADEGNKVGQMKEKFGRVTVYFHGLTDNEREEINRFARHVEEKFDCETSFH